MRVLRIPSIVVLFSALVCLGAFWAGGDNPYYHFEEFRFATYFNAVQILGCGFVAIYLFRIRKNQIGLNKSLFWLIVSAGSFFLALDEIFSFHDFDGLLITSFKKATGIEFPEHAIITQNFYLSYSDLILIAYGILVIVICFCFRQEFLQSGKTILFFGIAFLFLLSSALVDFNVLMKLNPYLDTRGFNELNLKAWEEIFKTMGFSMILAGMIFRCSISVSPKQTGKIGN